MNNNGPGVCIRSGPSAIAIHHHSAFGNNEHRRANALARTPFALMSRIHNYVTAAT